MLPELVAVARPGRRHRSDLGARRAERASAARYVAAEAVAWQRAVTKTYMSTSMAADGGALPGDARSEARRRGRLRLRQRHARPGSQAGRRRRVRVPGLRSAIHPAAVLPRGRAVPLGRLSATRPTSPPPTARAQGVRRTTPRSALRPPARASASGSRGCRRGSCWLGYGERHVRAGVQRPGRAGAVKAPIVIGRDHLDAGSVASPERETEGMRDGTDAVADWPILNALLNTSPAPPGSRCTTAAVWASASRSTPAWWSSPTAPPRRTRSSGAC